MGGLLRVAGDVGAFTLGIFCGAVAARYVTAGKPAVAPGDLAASRQGDVAVASVTLTERKEHVYNIETNGCHVYEATEIGVLVHNSAANSPFCQEMQELLAKRNNGSLTRAEDARVTELMIDFERSSIAPSCGKWNRPNVQDSTLTDVMDNLWRPQDKRPGGTIAELLREKAAGGPLIHLEKTKGRLTQLIRRVNDHSNPLSKADRAAAERVINDLKDAIRIAEGR